MVNGTETETIERRERPRTDRRGGAEHAPSLGVANLNPFGDLHTLQHLSARLARALRTVFEPVLRRGLRTWAEPLVVQRFADYSAERDGGLTAWLPLAMAPTQARAFAIFDGGFVLETLDLFFGGHGDRPRILPSEFTPAAEAMIGRLGRMIADPLTVAWGTMARLDFQPGSPEASPAMLQGVDGDDAMIVTRFGLAAGDGEPIFIDIVYPVAGLKPFAPTLTGKVMSRASVEPKWRSGLTRAAMNVRFPVRSVLAEPVISLATLMELKVGDVIPVSFGAEVPVMVGRDRLGQGIVGTSNGKAAIRITKFERDGDDADHAHDVYEEDER
ncbi:flagellar motor switch protein FliM [Sphingomonas sp. Leaf33]|uniref:flagellar motor switch protein FliM n=1 Tax=Sphingomonas sp. Leaf33 TaxID=1736215 RepID=UPI0006F28D7D|nr:flagellar motor switch protein FliM [Sphingomonas sp. Leaf33]KQN24853.1 flagellar motor switch protein FliM [Sphingomonas sp. Leaf33]